MDREDKQTVIDKLDDIKELSQELRDLISFLRSSVKVKIAVDMKAIDARAESLCNQISEITIDDLPKILKIEVENA